MKTLFKSLKITLVFCVFFSVFYILILWLFAQVAGPNKGNAEVATLDGKVVGTANVGEVTINHTVSTGNTLAQDGKTAPADQSELYGRFVPGTTGKLTIDGIAING